MKVNDVTLSATGGDPEKSQERSRTPCEASRSVCGVQNRFIDFPALHTEYADYPAAECDPRDYFGCCQIFICALTLRVNFIVTRRVCDLSLPGGRLGCHHRRWRCSAGSRRHRRRTAGAASGGRGWWSRQRRQRSCGYWRLHFLRYCYESFRSRRIPFLLHL